MRLLLALSFILMGCAQEDSFVCKNSLRNSYGENMLWYEDHIGVYINDNMSQYQQAVDNAVEKWNQYSKVKLVITNNSNTHIHLYASSDWSNREPSEQAFTGHTYYGNMFVRTAIVINTYNYTWYHLNGNGVEIESVLLHEFGHALGLHHFGQGIMKPTLPFNTTRIEFTEDDIKAIECQNLFNGRTRR